MSDRWQRVGALFDRALSLPVAERTTIIRDSGEPPDIQAEVLALLKAHEQSEGFLEPPSLLTPGAQLGPIASTVSSAAAAWAWSTSRTTPASIATSR
jgi:hypothetical protein